MSQSFQMVQDSAHHAASHKVSIPPPLAFLSFFLLSLQHCWSSSHLVDPIAFIPSLQILPSSDTVRSFIHHVVHIAISIFFLLCSLHSCSGQAPCESSMASPPQPRSRCFPHILHHYHYYQYLSNPKYTPILGYYQRLKQPQHRYPLR